MPEIHQSQRGYFAEELYRQMQTNENIWLITCDLGYGMLDKIRDMFPERFLNAGASEQAGMGIVTGLALKGKIPFIYSITPFLLWRPAETIRLYLNHEQIPVKMVGGGRDDDYHVDGFSHSARDTKRLVDGWENITQYWPEQKEEVPGMVEQMVTNGKPSFISLRR